MKKMLALTISALLVSGSAVAEDQPEELDRMKVEREAKDRPVKRYRNIYAPQFKEDDTSELRSEPCPDYFDTDWGLTHEPGDPCWNAYITSVGDENLPRAVRDQVAQESDAAETPAPKQSTTRPDTRLGRSAETEKTPQARCEEEDLGDQAVAHNAYEKALDAAEERRKASISSDLDPSAQTAKSVDQLRDSDIRQSHLDATFAALDDDSSSGIDRIEALGVRGLADEFDAVDFNDDGVISEGEFNLYFDGRLADNEAICLDGERISSIRQVEKQADFN